MDEEVNLELEREKVRLSSLETYETYRCYELNRTLFNRNANTSRERNDNRKVFPAFRKISTDLVARI